MNRAWGDSGTPFRGSVTLLAGFGCSIRAATVRERASRTRVMGVFALNRRFRYVERGSADPVTDLYLEACVRITCQERLLAVETVGFAR